MAKSKADEVLSNLPAGELGPDDYEKFIGRHSAAVDDVLRELGGYLKDRKLTRRWFIEVIACGAQLRSLTAAMQGIKAPQPWREAGGKYQKYLRTIDAYLDTVNFLLLKGQDPGKKLERQAADITRAMEPVSGAISRLARKRGVS